VILIILSEPGISWNLSILPEIPYDRWHVGVAGNPKEIIQNYSLNITDYEF
jgi:hypothetical protein